MPNGHHHILRFPEPFALGTTNLLNNGQMLMNRRYKESASKQHIFLWGGQEVISGTVPRGSVSLGGGWFLILIQYDGTNPVYNENGFPLDSSQNKWLPCTQGHVAVEYPEHMAVVQANTGALAITPTGASIINNPLQVPANAMLGIRVGLPIPVPVYPSWSGIYIEEE